MDEILKSVDKSWTLFLDRDGVINRRPLNDYVKSPADFEFMNGVKQALKILSQKFGRIIVVTNQQGIGKQLMSEKDLEAIHRKMLDEIKHSGGRIDKVYHCPDLFKKNENCRKPGIAMAKQAKTDFPEIDFDKSIMAGDTISDLVFAKNAKMYSVYINTNRQIINKNLYEMKFASLFDFAKSLLAND